MEVLTTEGRSFWLADADEIRPAGGLPVVEAVRLIAERFSFATTPTNVDELTFLEGAFEIGGRKIVIATLKIFPEGLSVEVRATTDEADIVLGEALRIGQSLGVRAPKTPPLIVRHSTIVFDFPKNIDHLIAPRVDLLGVLQETIPAYAPRTLMVVAAASDPAALPPRIASINPTTFRLERRSGADHSLNRYFSNAAATTGQHLEALRRIEQRLMTEG
jgi:hypothetical protein